jgi:hypothetical protein
MGFVQAGGLGRCFAIEANCRFSWMQLSRLFACEGRNMKKISPARFLKPSLSRGNKAGESCFRSMDMGRICRFVVASLTFLAAAVTLPANSAQVTYLTDRQFGFTNRDDWCKKFSEDRAWLTSSTAYGKYGFPEIVQSPVFTIDLGEIPTDISIFKAWAVPVAGGPPLFFQELGMDTRIQAHQVIVDDILAQTVLNFTSGGRVVNGYLEFRSPDGSHVARYGPGWPRIIDVDALSPVPVRETPLALGMISAPRLGGSSKTASPVTFALRHRGCRPLTLGATLWYRGEIRAVPFRAWASGPEQSTVEIDAQELSRLVNGALPDMLTFSANMEFVSWTLLETRFEILGSPSPSRIELDKKRCTFPIVVKYLYDRPWAIKTMDGQQQSLPFTILDSGAVTNRGKMRIDVPLDVVKQAVRAMPIPRLRVNIKGQRDMFGGGGDVFRLPIVKVPPNLDSVTPPGGCN